MSYIKCIWIHNDKTKKEKEMSLFKDATLNFSREKVNITFHKNEDETYLLFTWKNRNPHTWNHIYKCPTRFLDGMEIEWYGDELPGLKNHKKETKEKDSKILRQIKIVDSNWFNNLLTDFENI